MTILGCIADDFTGASDAASFLVKGGMSVQLFNGLPREEHTNADTPQAIVIALKSRTQNKDDAVRDSVNAARFLMKCGVQQIYFKYCSTFDSTPEGNIGPVADALIELLKVSYTLLCPSLPVNGRTVKAGNLYVNNVPLHESPMKNHPLTPMRDCRIAKLMEPQSKYPCYLSMPDTCREPFYIIPDYETQEDGEKIVAAYGHLPLLTGGSGLLEPLARFWSEKLSNRGKIPQTNTKGNAILLAGSCSKATLGQIAWYQKTGKPSYKLNPLEMLAGHQTVDDTWKFIKAHEGEPVLVYSSDTPEQVKKFQESGREKVAAMLENAMAELALRAVHEGYTRIISAGGETSGAVTKKLNFDSYWIGESIAPGVPVMIPLSRPDIRLILKSGNFGNEDFLCRALEVTEMKD